MTKGRDIALDGLRGLAALCVVFSHVAAMTWIPFSDKRMPDVQEWALWNLGAPAVDVFLVLSGYVVAGSLMRRPAAYGEYLLSRMVRLYPIAWLAVGAGLLLRSSGLTPPIGMTSGIELTETLTLDDIMGLMTMIAPIPNVNIINAPLWTLVLEMQAALAMPLLAVLGRRSPLALALAGVLLPFAVGECIGYQYPFTFAGFLIGAALAGAEHRIPRAPHPAAVLAFFGIMLMARHFLRTDDAIMRMPCALAAAGVILAIRQGAMRGVLETRAAQWLGSISYPLYAVHWPIMVAVTIVLGRTTGFTLAAIMSIPVSLAAAWALERAVDRPVVAFSRLLKSR